MIKRLFLNEAFSQALKSDMNFNHGAVVIYRGRIIGKGYNYYLNSNCKERASIHAEVSAINDAMKKLPVNELKKCELVIIRVNNAGECMNSKPCCNCEKYINKFCLKKVYHS